LISWELAHTETIGTETDDVIASYVFAYSHQVEIVISSFDSDFFQLINDNTTVLRYRGGKTAFCDVQYIKEKYGIMPTQYADFKSLVGDSADHIRGAEKIGPKTAAKLVNRFGTVEKIIKYANLVEKQSVRESIIRNADRLWINHQLIKFKCDAPMPFLLQQTQYTYSGVTTTEVLRKIGLK